MRTHHRFTITIRSDQGATREEAMQAASTVLAMAAPIGGPKLDVLLTPPTGPVHFIHIQQKGTPQP